MNSPLVCRLADELAEWPRKELMYLSEVLSAETDEPHKNLKSTIAAWAYIHGLVMLRIDHLFPEDLPEPDWDKLVRAINFLSLNTF